MVTWSKFTRNGRQASHTELHKKCLNIERHGICRQARGTVAEFNFTQRGTCRLQRREGESEISAAVVLAEINKFTKTGIDRRREISWYSAN